MVAVVREPAVVLRSMQEADLPAVLEVERGGYSSPWSEGIFRDCLRVRYCCLVAQYLNGQQLVAHAVMSVAAGECHVLNLCVRQEFQGRGIGRLMLRRLLALARRQGADTAFLEVRSSNHAAISLYRGEGFDEIGVRAGYYPAGGAGADEREDAVMMARTL